MDQIIADLATKNKLFVRSKTACLFQAFLKHGSPFTARLALLPIFSMLVFIGIGNKHGNAALLLALLTMSFIWTTHEYVTILTTQATSDLSRRFYDCASWALSALMWLSPLSVYAIWGAFSLAYSKTKYAVLCFYVGIILSYYSFDFFTPGKTLLFYAPDLLRFLMTAPLFFATMMNKKFNNFASAVVFAFVGLWGILSIAAFTPSLQSRKTLNTILADLFLPNYLSIAPISMYFVAVGGLSVFCQYSFLATKNIKELSGITKKKEVN